MDSERGSRTAACAGQRGFDGQLESLARARVRHLVAAVTHFPLLSSKAAPLGDTASALGHAAADQAVATFFRSRCLRRALGLGSLIGLTCLSRSRADEESGRCEEQVHEMPRCRIDFGRQQPMRFRL